MKMYKISFIFPSEEKYSLTDQIRRSSRSVSAYISEAWCKRRHPKSFVSKLTDAEGEARETQTWLEFSYQCNYIEEEKLKYFNEKYDEIIALLIYMINNVEKWTNFNSKD